MGYRQRDLKAADLVSPPIRPFLHEWGKGRYLSSGLGSEDGEDLIGVCEPGFDEPRFLGLVASQFGHGAQHEKPVERFLVATLF